MKPSNIARNEAELLAIKRYDAEMQRDRRASARENAHVLATVFLMVAICVLMRIVTA